MTASRIQRLHLTEPLAADATELTYSRPATGASSYPAGIAAIRWALGRHATAQATFHGSVFLGSHIGTLVWAGTELLGIPRLSVRPWARVPLSYTETVQVHRLWGTPVEHAAGTVLVPWRM